MERQITITMDRFTASLVLDALALELKKLAIEAVPKKDEDTNTIIENVLAINKSISSLSDVVEQINKQQDESIEMTVEHLLKSMSNPIYKACMDCHWYQQRGGQFECTHELGECKGERFEQEEP